jgi:predicted urease superfamily metal-dependent hydrolase
MGLCSGIEPADYRSLDVATWDARTWLAGLIGCDRSDLAVRSVDKYGPLETQVRYERGNEAVARLIVSGPIVPMGEEGRGHWAVSVRIGTGSEDVHTIDIPEADEIAY